MARLRVAVKRGLERRKVHVARLFLVPFFLKDGVCFLERIFFGGLERLLCGFGKGFLVKGIAFFFGDGQILVEGYRLDFADPGRGDDELILLEQILDRLGDVEFLDRDLAMKLITDVEVLRFEDKAEIRVETGYEEETRRAFLIQGGRGKEDPIADGKILEARFFRGGREIIEGEGHPFFGEQKAMHPRKAGKASFIEVGELIPKEGNDEARERGAGTIDP